jgi:hypothetical protein
MRRAIPLSPAAAFGLVHAFVLALVLALATPLAAAPGRPQVAATRASSPIVVDGRLDEPDWARAQPIRAFQLIFVREGQAPSESTEVRVLFDDRRIYFGIRCENRGPGAIRASLAPRDQIADGDFVAIQLDTYRDLHRAYVFGVNPYGVQLDGILTGGDVDFTWDSVWDSAARRDSTGWTAEIAVPLRALRFPEGGPGVWGLWIRRSITKNDEVCSWPLWRQSVPGDIMLQAADLTGLAGLHGGGLFEVQPYGEVTSTSVYGPAPGRRPGPLGWTTDTQRRAGVDVEFAPTATLVTNATYKPDFSQVEADQLQFDVNLRDPLYYPEKRPFFVEGADFFTTPLNLVYTRRIADPEGGGKLTGTLGRLRLGALVARDDGGASLAGVGGPPNAGVARDGTFEIGRASLEMGEQSSLGVLVAAHQSSGTGPDPAGLRSNLDRTDNLDLAADWRAQLVKPLFFTGQLARSATTIDTAVFAQVVSGGMLVPMRFEIGHAFTDLAYQSALTWDDGTRYVQASQSYLGPEFRAESGFLSRVDLRRSVLDAEWTVRPENGWLRNWKTVLHGEGWHDHAGALQESQLAPGLAFQFQKQTQLQLGYERVHERWLSRFYDQNHTTAVISNTLWRALSVDLSTELGEAIFYGPTDTESFGGWIEQYALTATARPSARLTSAITVSRQRFSHDHGHGVVFDQWLVGANTTFQFTRQLYARAYPQFDSEADHFEGDALLGYVVHPGTVVYLGWNDGVDRVAGVRRETQRTLYAKASVLYFR